MDPNRNLDEQLALAKQIQQYADEHPTERISGDTLKLAELVEALDHWITGGGFLPDRWNRPGTPGGLYVGKDRD